MPVLLACGGCSAPAVEVRHAVGAARCVDIPVQLEQADAHAVLPLRLQVLARLRSVLGDEGELVRDARGLEQGVEAGELQRPLGVLLRQRGVRRLLVPTYDISVTFVPPRMCYRSTVLPF